MLINEDDASDLKIWVTRKLEDISDADSDVLADYVLALIRSDVPNSVLRDNTVSQLEDFLGEHAADFVDELLRVIANRTYTNRPSATNDFLNDPRKTGRSDRAPASTGATPLNSVQTVRSSQPSAEQGRKRPTRDAQNGGEQPSLNQAQADAHQKRKRGGSTSQNGRPSQALPRQAVKGPMRPVNTSSSSFNDNRSMFPFNSPQSMAAAMLSMQAMGLPVAMNPNGQNSHGRQPCLDYETQGLCVRGANCPYDHGINQIIVPQSSNYDPSLAGMTNINPNFMDMAAFLGASVSNNNNNNNNGPGHRSEPHRFRRSELSMPGPNHNRSITTVVVEQIPEDNFEEDQVRAYFTGFGQIEEISMQAYKRLAIVRYSQYESAKAAYESPKAIFDNRFVKVYWYKADTIPTSKPGSGPAVKKEASSDGTHSDATKEPEFNMAEFVEKTADAQQKFDERNKKRQELELESQKINQQCRELEKTTREVKLKLDEKMREAGLDPSPDMIPVNSLQKSRKQRDADLLKTRLAALEAQARELGLDLHTLDDDTLSESSYYRSPPPPRGRGRYRSHYGYHSHRGRAPYSAAVPRGGYRGRGRFRGAYAGPFKGTVHADGRYNLDLRPRRIRLTAVDEEQWSEDKDEALREHLFNFGEYECIESVPGGEAGDAIVTFKDRQTAEAFYYSPRDVPNIGSFHLSWIPNPAVTTESVLLDDGGDVVMDDSVAGRSEPDRGERDEAGSDAYRRHDQYDVGEVDERWIV